MRATRRGAVCAATLALVLAVSTSGVAAAAPTWRLTALPWTTPGPATTWLSGVSCTGGTCLAVGRLSSQGSVPLAETRTGSGWTALPAPAPPASDGEWTSVSCATPTFCAAVGEEEPVQLDPVVGSVTLLGSTWDGATWTTSVLGTFVGLSLAQLFAVSCGGTTCVALGEAGTPDQPLGYELSGGTWKGTNPPGPAESALTSISCADSSDCTAVGEEQDGDALVDTLRAGTWTSIVVPPPSGSDLSPSGISCWGPSTCDAVGTWNLAVAQGGSDPVGMLLQITGATVRVVQFPVAVAELHSVVCFSATSCIANGGEADGDGQTAIAATLSGSIWTAAPLPSPSGDLSFGSLGCSSVTSCEVVDGSDAASLVATTWSLDEPPVLSGPPQSRLTGLACPYAGHCIAVGTYASPSYSARPFVESLRAGSWARTIPALPAGAVAATLSGLACPGPHDCVAVGGWTDAAGRTRPYVDVMTRGTWTPTSLPIAADYPIAALRGVSCSSTTACVAVGTASSDGSSCETCGSLPIAATLSGSVWTITFVAKLPVPGVLGNSASLTSVSCWAKARCVAVGLWYPDGAFQSSGLIDTLDGTWRSVSAPSPKAAIEADLDGVSCVSSSECQLVGQFETDRQNPIDLSAIPFPLFETGAATGSWRLDRPTGAPVPTGSLDGISCSNGTTCAAVGANGIDAVTAELIGGTWHAATAPPAPGHDSANLAAIACLAYSGCVSVGSTTANGATVPVVATP